MGSESSIPYKGWNLEVDNYQTNARNWLDHNNIGNSKSLLAHHLVRGSDPGLGSHVALSYAVASATGPLGYANQIAQATSPINGGLICPNPNDQTCPLFVPPGLSPVDHDQRNTLNVGATATLPWQSFASGNVYYGSGFVNGLYGTPDSQYPGAYLPSHHTVDLSLGKSLEGKSPRGWSAKLRRLHYQLDNSNTFGGTHYGDPRMIGVQIRYKFHY